MPKIKTDREAIIQSTIHLFKVKGYYNTTMSDIGAACGLIKGSLYHHFKSKEDLALACLKYIHDYFDLHIFAISQQSELGSQQQLSLFTDRVEDYFLHSEGGCLLGNFALELSNNIPLLKSEILSYFTDWEQALCQILTPELGKKPARYKARESVAATQGAIMMMRLYDNSEQFREMNRQLKLILKK